MVLDRIESLYACPRADKKISQRIHPHPTIDLAREMFDVVAPLCKKRTVAGRHEYGIRCSDKRSRLAYVNMVVVRDWVSKNMDMPAFNFQ